ncbi:Rieske 2Fe-2S domain-containing protein [Kitasatospora purpeofusca]|nr:Rieske 2Fe-2S domain-containing protein [Kitasatospora purpeofusca]
MNRGREIDSQDDRPSAGRYPNGWFAVAFTEELGPGKVVTGRLAGKEVVIYRTRSGKLNAVRPYCPHISAMAAKYKAKK